MPAMPFCWSACWRNTRGSSATDWKLQASGRAGKSARFSIRSTVRMTGVAKNTVTKLILELGAACTRYQSERLVNLPCRRLQCDEIWSYVGGKDKNLSEEKKQSGLGLIWTWTALDADTKLIASWLVGSRDAGSAYEFMQDVASRLRGRVQLTTDGHRPYLQAVEAAFGVEIDFAVLVKLYGAEAGSETRYSPAICLGCEVKTVTGSPDPKHISTSYVERQNLTMRMSMRRFTRLTNAISKKAEMHAHTIALHFMYYNFARIHQTLRVTPAMEAGVSGHVWSLEEIVALLP